MNLQWFHYRTLEHAEKYGLSDLNYDRNIPTLVEAGYLVGSWYGSLEYSPGRRWAITKDGRKALKEYKVAQLIASTSKCPEGTCRGEYGSECYLKTECITCGRDIIRG